MTNFKDITGQRFGRLTVICLSGRNKHKQTVWKCKCDCGNECVASKTHLITGHTESCGCLMRETSSKNGKLRFKDITGRKFWKLTAIKPHHRDDKNYWWWVFKCDCGEEKIARASEVASGNIKRCGKCPIKNLIGKKFGRLSVIDFCKKNNTFLWKCKCDCGNETLVSATSLYSGTSKSCGCLKKELLSEEKRTHDDSKTRLYRCWISMKNRCYNDKSETYRYWGGKGIAVCESWKNSFEDFKKWSIANGYKNDLTLDRIDINKNYEPKNCRWVPKSEQPKNCSQNVYFRVNGENFCLSDTLKITGASRNEYYKARKLGKTKIEDLFKGVDLEKYKIERIK